MFKPEPDKLLKYLADTSNKARLLPENRLRMGIRNGHPEEILRLLQSFRKAVT